MRKLRLGILVLSLLFLLSPVIASEGGGGGKLTKYFSSHRTIQINLLSRRNDGT